ncbi:MAG: Coenzyme F420 hydrogenase/dehydrogenase, beta subunit C-terminal domain [Candidatus Hydrothermarchaeales archaeon]
MRFEELKKDIIDPGFCIHCGACTAFCNRLKLNLKPELVEECVATCSSPYGEHGLCYEHCPMVRVIEARHIFPQGEGGILGNYKGIKSARSKEDEVLKNAQDGGVATSILAAAFKTGKIDAALIVGRDELWKSAPRLITSLDELKGSGGSKYTETPAVHLLGKASRDGAKSIAVVAVSCQIQALRNLEYSLLYPDGFSPYSDLKIYVIGLFCSGAFSYERLLQKLDVDPKEIEKMDVEEGDFTLHYNGKVKKIPLKELKDAMMPSCRLCRDYTAKLADISLGSIGTKPGWTTVIERNLKGWGLLRDAQNEGLVEVKEDVDKEKLERIVKKRLDRIEKRIKRRLEEKLPLPPVTFQE